MTDYLVLEWMTPHPVTITPKTALPPGMGFFAHFVDSEGNRVGLHSLE